MKTQLNITATSPAMCRAIARNPNWTTSQLHPGKNDGHRFKPGDLCVLHGLESYPEHNGETVKIEAIRTDGEHGKAYYVEGAINEAINWVYEYRLKPL